MKLSNQQVKALASQVLSKIRENLETSFKLNAQQKKQIDKILTLKERVSKSNTEITRLNNEIRSLQKSIGVPEYTYTKTKSEFEDIIKRQKRLPNIQDIENKIIIETVFTDKKDLSEFIEKLVKQFS